MRTRHHDGTAHARTTRQNTEGTTPKAPVRRQPNRKTRARVPAYADERHQREGTD